MLTRSLLTSPRLRVADLDLDPDQLARSASEIATHDLPRLVRRADVPGRLEAGMDAASDAIHSVVEQVPGRRRRSPWQSWVPGLAIVSVLVALAIGTWWFARSAALSTEREIDLELDEDALERATDEGMREASASYEPSTRTVPDVDG